MHQSNFSLSSHLLAGRELDLFFTLGILDERAHYTIGDAVFTLLVLFFGAFGSVFVYLNELFFNKKDTLHDCTWPLGMSPSSLLFLHI